MKLKLKYQIDKLIKASVDDENNVKQAGESLHPISLDDLDPLAFKPNPSALLHLNGPSEDNDNVSATVQDNLNSGDGIYRPPRLAPVHYDEGSKSAKSSKLTEKIKDKASKSRLLRDLQQQYDDAPEDMDAMGLGYSGKETVKSSFPHSLLTASLLIFSYRNWIKNWTSENNLKKQTSFVWPPARNLKSKSKTK